MPWSCSNCGAENPAGTRFCGQCGTPRADSPATVETAPRTDRDADVAEALRSFVSGQVADRLLESGGTITEERRLVTCLFADLSGFTPLADRLDPEQLLEVIDPVIERMTNVVAKYEGYVDKFAGDALLAFFGAPTAHEDDADRALLVAQEMHAELARILPELPPDAGELTLHTGVNSGHVIARVLGTDVRMDYSVLGDAVILAQRLESATPAGETYVGVTTYRLTRDRFDFEHVGQLTLKGKAQPVDAWRLIGQKIRADSGQTSTFVGREEELNAITRALESVEPESGTVISVSGEPGVGKTRLTEEVRSVARARGYEWITARCLSYGSGIPYWPFADLIRRLVGINPSDKPTDAARLLADQLESRGISPTRPYFARLLGYEAPELVHLDPEAYRRELHQAFVTLLQQLASDTSVVLAVEDLHWADSSSVSLVTEITKLTANLSLIVYLTARVESLPVLLEIAAGAPEGFRHSVQLQLFGPSDTEALVRSFLGTEPPPRLVELIAERSQGNPFFTQEILMNLQDAGTLTRSNGSWSLSQGVSADVLPPTIEGVLSSRIDLLPRRAASVLHVASVIGRRVRIPLLRAVEKDRHLDAALEQLVHAGLLDPSTEEDDELVFHHALVLDVAYSRLLRKRRRELHVRVAEQAEALYGAGDDTIDLLARHLYLGEGGAKAIEYLLRAGERARGMFANDEAIQHFTRSLELAEELSQDPSRRASMLRELGDIYDLTGRYEEALNSYTRARDLTGEIRAWRGMASSLRSLGRNDSAEKTIEEAFEACRGDLDRAFLWLERGFLLMRQGSNAEAINAFDEGLRVAEADSKIFGELLTQRASAKDAAGSSEEAIDDALKAKEIFQRLGDLQSLATTLRTLAGSYQGVGRLDDAADTAREALVVTAQTGAIEERAATLINLGLIEMERGNLSEAINVDRQAAAEFERVGLPVGTAIAYGNLAEYLMMAGELDEATEYSHKAFALAAEIKHTPVLADVSHTLARLHEKKGEYAQAASVAEEAAGFHLEIDMPQLAIESLTLAAAAWKQAGETERALDVLRRARSIEL